MLRYDALVLAGGAARRLGGVDKPMLRLGDTTLVERALAAVVGADRTVVVGPERDYPAYVEMTREHPPGGGPAAAVVAGLALVSADLVVVLAADLPFVTEAHVEQLLAAAEAHGKPDAVVFVDTDGRRQPLAAVYGSAPLRAAAGRIGAVDGASMRTLTKSLTLVEVEADSVMTLDCDTWDDVARAHEIWEER